jgi:hypothetical protein
MNLGNALNNLVCLGDAETKHVYQWITGVALFEGDLAADGWNADAVAVSGDAGDNAFQVTPHTWVLEGSESQRVHQRDGPRTHREDVTNDAPNAGGSPLIRLYKRRMVVRFDLEDRSEAVADIDGAGVFARTLQHARAGRR